jgi:anthranilate phosphoribosyltransferase
LHGPLHAQHGGCTALVLRELGILPCAHKEQVERALATRRIAFVPDALLAPGLAALLGLRARLGPLPLLVTVARLIDPFDCGALVIASGDAPSESEAMRAALAMGQGRALLLQPADSESGERTLLRPRIEYWRVGESQLLFEQEPTRREAPSLPFACDAKAWAAWIMQACAGSRSVPTPIVNEIAATLYAQGYCSDFNQAKALAAIAVARRRVA